ncbi:Metallo-dependent phosphatase-like protein [Podospora fimiseda]|uniref:Metallo-dependent phosphatase-like protein n=1 Tax=Podospora fimiseda TaxID=252190 RepID=A0AAN7GUG5_9PEZI|nr:Metallo-dependent phosphatase-like protein [Podospora fimiseda]
MIPQAITHCFNRRTPRATLFIIFASLSFLTLCIFLLHLPSIKQVGRIPSIFGSFQDENEEVVVPGQPPPMTSSTPSIMSEQPHKNTNFASEQMPIIHINHDDDTEKQEQYPEMTQYTNHHPPIFPAPTLIADLPSSATLPSTSTSTPKSRLIIVGDVHGYLEPLKQLLRKIEFNPHNNYNIDTGTHKGHHYHGKTKDHLIFVGDMITRGPDSRGVVDLAIKTGASAVRGNHEDRVLAAARGMKRLDRNEWTQQDISGENQYNSSDSDSDSDSSSQPAEAAALRRKKKRKDDHARKIAKSLSRSQLAWLESLPIILRIGHFSSSSAETPWDASQIVVVHGGLIPGVKLELQDPWAVMNMRSLLYPRRRRRKRPKHKADDEDDNDTFESQDTQDEEEDEEEYIPDPTEFLPQNSIPLPIDNRKGEPWSRAWNRYQNALSLSKNPLYNTTTTVVIYGHDAKAGLQADMEVDIGPFSPKHKKKRPISQKKKAHLKGVRYAFGLDSGCGHGKKLTGLVIEVGEDDGKVGHKLVQVDCGVGVDQEGGVEGKEEEGHE